MSSRGFSAKATKTNVMLHKAYATTSTATANVVANLAVLRDVSGNVNGNIINASGLNLTSISLKGNLATSAASGNIVPPANVVGYIVGTAGGVQVKIPYYPN